jgi:hypothetical protein
MPWKVIGNKIYKKKGGKWILHQTCKSEKNAHIALGIIKRNTKE